FKGICPNLVVIVRVDDIVSVMVFRWCSGDGVLGEEEEGEAAIMVVRCFLVLGSGSDLPEIGMAALMAEVSMKMELEGVLLVGHGGCATVAIREKR
ncbi:hypothetical protein HAX54_004940, partial [Datura stramonium]|nr:hypothetical protein [Datura stramonium]